VTFKTVPITAVKVGPLATDADHVKMLAESIEQLGGELINPITVNKQMVLIAGAHRYRAARLAGKTRIDVKIVDAVGHDAALIRLDENLGQKHRPALELAEMLRERKAAYELKHPDAPKRGGDRSKTKSVRSATASVAKETGRTERSVQQYVAVAEKLAPKAKKKLKGTEAANSITDLQRLAKLEPEHQVAVAERVAETGETVKQAAKALNREKQVDQAKAYVLPAGEWPVIAIDPPWSYDDKLDGSDAARGGTPYPSMSIEEIAALELPLAKDAAVFLWVTNSHLIDPEAYAIVAATWKGKYGLEPKGIATWEKDKLGLGSYFRNKTEHLVLLVRGKPVFTEEKPWSHFRAPVGEHSEKPAAAYMAIEKFCAATQRLELFARAPRPGWVTTGSELPADLEMQAALDELEASDPGVAAAAADLDKVTREILEKPEPELCGAQDGKPGPKNPPCIMGKTHDGAHSNGYRTWPARKRKLPPIIDVTESP
jgi:N6-adenosine-specific RNA methylase IME4/ParB-like chromosome segregation protein Spo0J